jgi:glycosyltransferase involved in cell wall biosynthesis
MQVKYHRNTENIGIPGNFLNVVRMAEGEFAWLLGDDDLVLPDGIERICRLIEEHPAVDFFYVNSFHLNTEYVLSYPQPFSTDNLPTDMDPFSKWEKDGEIQFLDLVDPKISFDFLGGMFLAVFRREKWREAAGVLDPVAIADRRTFSAFDNTFPHVKIFAHAFAKSKAYFNAAPPSVCLTGAREWAPMYPMVRSVRLIEALQEYRRNGLPFRQYVRCKNFALRAFIPDIVYTFIHKKISGYAYINPARLVIQNCLYPGLYLSIWYYAERKLRGPAVRVGRQSAVAASHRGAGPV